MIKMKNLILSIAVKFFCFCVASHLQVLSKTAEDEMKDISAAEGSLKNFTSHDNTLSPRPQPSLATVPHVEHECKDANIEDLSNCLAGQICSELGGGCIICDFDCSCSYGKPINITCIPKNGVECSGTRTFQRQMICQYCYQTPAWEHNCSGTADCPAISSPRKMFKANCSVKSEVICMGNRNFPKRIPCNWTSGYQWSTALILSITLGGFGADRFYLGHWQEGIGKLFSFGGLGVWTIIDVILISIRYLGPSNDSLYI